MNYMTPTQLKEYLEHANPPPLLLDVREPWEYEICHIEGTRLIPMSQVPGKVNELERDQEIVVICHHGRRSEQVGLYLQRMGFTRIVNLTGGVHGWAREVDPSMPTY
ncbi:MAG: rhodanese-like domain-containing protein [Pseudomonadota bacterium]